MALIVEDGTIVAGAEAFGTVAGADTHHAARGRTLWTGTTAAKEQALRIGNAWWVGEVYRRGSWPGYASSATQALPWPRRGAYTVEGWPLDSDAIPAGLLVADYEAAYLVLTGVDLFAAVQRGGRVRRVKVGPIEKEYEPTAPGLAEYPAVWAPLRPLLWPRRLLLS